MLKTSTPSVAKLRKTRLSQGIKRRELYLTDAEWLAAKAFIAQLRASIWQRLNT